MASIMRASSEYSMDSPKQTIDESRKRKGGRKAMYTEEARKQRNRDAQAAFRERRIEYIKELEERVKSYSARLRCMEAARTSSMDECLMLRYKNSLLERILLHKGIDVNAELNTKLWRPVKAPTPPHPVQGPIPPHQSLRGKANTQHPSSGSEMTSPLSTASESTLPTPPAPAPAPTAHLHKRRKAQNFKDTNQVLYPPDGSDDPGPAHSRAIESEFVCNPGLDVDFFGTDENGLGMMGFEDFDFSMEFPVLNPVLATSALSF